MTANVIGTWDGTMDRRVTQVLPSDPAILRSALRLSIETQGGDEKVVKGWDELTKDFTQRVVSTIFGHISRGGWDPHGQVVFEDRIPVAGFIDDAGVIKLGLYDEHPESVWSGSDPYVGRLTRPLLGVSIISGNVGSSSSTLTFSVKKLGWDLSDSTYLHSYDHLPF